MNTNKLPRYILFELFAAFIVLLSACQPAAFVNNVQPTQPLAEPTTVAAILVTQAPVKPPSGALNNITLDYSALAQNATVETVAAVPANADGPWWEAAPQYRRITLQGYPVANHLYEPQIFIYPVGELASANENMGKTAASLQALLQTQETGEELPFLPLFNARQVMHPQVQSLDFKNGKGVRFLTQFSQGIVPINNSELIYTFQGLTSDGKYYIAAVLPVTNPELPADSKISEQMVKAINDDPGYYSGYLSTTVGQLNQQPADSFTPDLNKLDALISSIEIK